MLGIDDQTVDVALKSMKAMLPMPEYFPSSTVDWSLSVYAPHTAIWAIYCFLRSPHSFWDSLLHCISIGGDTDTAASITGAISGAYNGLGEIRNPCVVASKYVSQVEEWQHVIGKVFQSIRDDVALEHPAMPNWNILQLRAIARTLHTRCVVPLMPNNTNTNLNNIVCAQHIIHTLMQAKQQSGSKPDGSRSNVVFVGLSGFACKETASINMAIMQAVTTTTATTATNSNKVINCVSLHQKNYVKTDEIGLDLEALIDHDAFARDVSMIASWLYESGGGVVIVEGSRIFDPTASLFGLFDWHVWVDVSEHSAKANWVNEYQIPSLREEASNEPLWKNVWQLHCKCEATLRATESAVVIQPTEPSETILSRTRDLAGHIAAQL